MTSTISPPIEGGGRIMITNNGTHPPEFWAQVTAEQICPIGDNVTGHRRIAALALQAKIAQVLEPHHTNVQGNEKSKLVADPAHCLRDVDPETDAGTHADAALADVVAASVGTEWESHFKDTVRQAAIRDEIVRHFATAQDIERRAHVDRTKGAA